MTNVFKTITFLGGLFVVAIFVASAPTDAREAIIGLSPNQTPAALEAQAERVITHLVETVDPGETALIFDALNVELIGSLAVPDNEAYANPRAKLQANRQVLSALKAFFEAAEPDTARPGAVDLPDFLRTIGEHYPSEADRSIIVIGSPIYDNPLAPSLSMVNGRVPNDGLLTAPLSVSPFTTLGLNGSLEGDDVFFGIAPDVGNWQVSTDHGFHVERLWTLSVEGHGGAMGYFGEDLETLFRLAATDVDPSPHSHPLVPTDKLETIQFSPDQGRGYRAPLEDGANTSEIDWRNARNVTFRATWSCMACDLDLYVRASPEADPIYYGRPSTPEGQMYKDMIHGPTNGFEIMVLSGITDLTTTLVAMNFYAGEANDGPVTGTIELSVGDAMRTVPFTLEARTGNRGDGLDIVLDDLIAPDQHWFVLSDLVGAVEG